MDKKILRRMTSLLKMAEDGEGQEKAVAQQHLNTYLEKHQITIEELRSQCLRERRDFTYEHAYELTLLKQVFRKNIPGWDGSYFLEPSEERTLYIDATDDEAVRIKEDFMLYSGALAKEVDDVVLAFIIANKITAAPSEHLADELEDDEGGENSPYYEKLATMASGMEEVSGTKRLKNTS